MQAITLPGFEHRPGQHCGSTALADVAAYRGHPLEEAVCFGLGSGLAFFYVQFPAPPYRALAGRGPGLEEDFFRHLDIRLEWQRGPGLDLSALLAAVEAGNPVLVKTDLAYLDYYRTKTHFSGHVVVLAGYDRERQTVLLADTERPGLQEIPWESLRRSMASDFPYPHPLENEWVAIPPFPSLDLPRACRRALEQTVATALQPDVPAMGPRAFEAFAAEIGGWWREVENWRWTYRFAYQAIEKRGTGGGNFRRLFAGFMHFAADKCPDLGLGPMEQAWLDAADGWTALAYTLKEVSETPEGERPDPALLSRAVDLVAGLGRLEGQLLADLAARLNPSR